MKCQTDMLAMWIHFIANRLILVLEDASVLEDGNHKIDERMQ